MADNRRKTNMVEGEAESKYKFPAFGEEVRCIVKRLGITQQELVNLTGMSFTTLQDFFKGKMCV